jgi:hypothetical protein
MLKPGRAQQAVDIASMMPAEWATGLVGKGAPAVVGAIRRKGDVMPQVSAAILQKSMVPKDVALDDSPSANIIKDKIAKWLVKSAGESDSILEKLPAVYGSVGWSANPFPEPKDAMDYFRTASEGRLSPAGFSKARGLPEAPPGSLQELTDFSLKDAFIHGYGDVPASGFRPYSTTREESAAGARYGSASEVGMTPENFQKMMEIMPEGSIMARPSQSILGVGEFGSQIRDLSEWAADQDPAKLQKMTIPQMFQARHTDLAQAIKEYEKGQRGTVEMRFPEKGLEWQKLEPQHLKREGKEAAHCVGGYCEEVKSGEMQVFSLRDEKNKPKVTISIKKAVGAGRTWDIVRDGERVTGFKVAGPEFVVDQIKGKANSVPVEYADEVEAFLDAKGWDYKDSGDWRRLESEIRRVANGAPEELEGRLRAQFP